MNICVFSSSSNAIDDVYFEEAQKLGQIIGEKGHTLINGGSNVGLMETVTVAASEAGAHTIGIIPVQIAERDLASSRSQQLIVTPDMTERKQKMRELADAFIALPGGFGTLEEVLEVLTLRQLNYHQKPIVFINTNNFFKHLFRQFEVSFEQNFAKPVYKELYFTAPNSTEAMNHLSNYAPVELDAKWFVVPTKE